VTEVGTKALIHGLVKLMQYCVGTDPTSKFRGGDFSDIWHSSLIPNSLL